MNDATIGGVIIGGDANLNSVTMSAGSATGIRGGFAQNGTAMGNMVNIRNGTVTGDVFGGQSNAGAATGNIIAFDGGII